jgi:hypothetical protein
VRLRHAIERPTRQTFHYLLQTAYSEHRCGALVVELALRVLTRSTKRRNALRHCLGIYSGQQWAKAGIQLLALFCLVQVQSFVSPAASRLLFGIARALPKK